MSARLVALVEVVLCSGFPTQLLLVTLFQHAGWSPLDEAGRLSSAYVTMLTAADAVLVIALAFAFMAGHGDSPRALLLGHRSVRGEVRLGVLLVPPVLVGTLLLVGAIRVWLPSLHNVARNPLEDLLVGPAALSLFVTVLVVAGGLREEVQRAFILRRFDRYLGGGVVGLIVFSLAFGAGHLDQGRDVAAATTGLGLFWGWMYLRRRSIASPLANHVGFNLAQALQFLIVRA
jgi:membrane protease YdiL (CAAX protease family)